MERDFEMNANNCFGCYKCDKYFPSHEEVVIHLKLIHNACAALECKNISDFEMHSSVCSKGFVCVVCHEKFLDKLILLTHFNNHIDVAYFVCDICRAGFQGHKDLQKHLFEIHNKNTDLPDIHAHSQAVYQKCYQCSKYFKLFSEFEEHKYLCDSLTYACNICKIKFSSSILLENHKHIEHKSYLPLKGYLALEDGKRYFCGICYLGFLRGCVLKEHIKTHDTKLNYNCDVCHLSFISDEDLQEHYLQHIEEHYSLLDVIQQHSCASCKRMFKTHLQLENHLGLGICTKRAWGSSSPHLLSSNISNGESLVSDGKSVSDTIELEQMLSSSSTNENSSTAEPNGYSHCCNKHGTISPDKKNAESVFNNMDVSQSKMCTDIDISDIPVYILKSGDELLNCDDSNCVVVIDHQSVFVLQRGICVSEDRMPDLSNVEAYQETDNIDAALLKSHMLQILYPTKENNMSKVEYSSNSKTANEIFYQQENDMLHVTNNSNCKIADETNKQQESDAELGPVDTITLEISSTDNVILEEDMLKQIYEAILKGKSDGTELADKQSYKIGVNGNTYTIIQENKVPSIDAPCREILQKEENTVPSIDTHFGENLQEDSLREKCEPYICNICLQVFSSKISLCLHTKESHTGFDCFDCGLSFSTESDLSQHEIISHQSLFKCGICNVSFEKEKLLKEHKCATLATHGDKQFECSYCNKSYERENYFNLHMMKHHLGETPLKCDECSKVYSSVSGLKNHKALHHEGKSLTKNHVCSICDSAFCASLPLKKHMRTHLKQLPNNFKCPKCYIYFTQKMLLKHLDSH